ncbi:MAG: 4'-phosphopantetheinyl transferase superfamily protein [Pseudomonadales bacterium]|nr:4'-phosphopantetheinyl transferase superfamily protein [Halioglobus sp.]MCP5128677.1 4'-phosphopantetheinyl transferase superfamily protein [Pseudomonadales bacterium]
MPEGNHGTVNLDTCYGSLSFTRPFPGSRFEIPAANDRPIVLHIDACWQPRLSGPTLSRQPLSDTGLGANRTRESSNARRLLRGLLDKVAPGGARLEQDVPVQTGWPQGVSTSITHCLGLTLVVAANDSRVGAVGIDMEKKARFSHNAVRKFLSANEYRNHQQLDPALSFCAKESIFKALPAERQKGIDFRSIDIALNPANGTFSALSTLESGNGFAHPRYSGYYFDCGDFWFCLCHRVRAAED